MITYPNIKINLGLNVLRKRSDGYHDIETLFYPVHEIHDTLEIIAGDDFSRTSAEIFSKYGAEGENPMARQGMTDDGKLIITVARKEGVDWDPLSDLCAKAYLLLDKEFQLPPVKIFLEKSSPVGAGLGGGSSDAAYMLKLLNERFGLNIPTDKLEEYAARLGADCAFFVRNQPVYAEGIGNVFTPIKLSLKGYGLIVIKPDVFVSTRDAFAHIKPHRPAQNLQDLVKRPINEWKENIINDFEASVFPKFPIIGTLKEKLYQSGAIYAAMSGSGSSVYGLFTPGTLLPDMTRKEADCRVFKLTLN